MVRAEVLSLPSSTGQRSSEQLDLAYLMGKTHKLSCFIFLSKDAYPGSQDEREKLLQCFNLPRLVFTDMGHRCNGYFGARENHDDTGKLKSFSTWFRCLVKTTYDIPTQYKWNEMTFFSSWEPGHCVVLCIDTPDGFRDVLQRKLEREQSPNLQDPFAFLVPLLDEIILLYDRSVWGIRDLIRKVETEREEHHARDTDFSQLHEISRHATHSTETLSVTSDSMGAMMQRYMDFHQNSSDDNAHWKATQQQISLQSQLIRNLKLRSQANQERLQGEITLAYNRIAQRDSKVMLEMSAATKSDSKVMLEISAATKSDSKAMKTVALVTMIFLPATFTSAVFSMSFFNFSPETGNWTVSHEFWVYWVVAIPLTGLTLLFWLFFLQEPGARPALTLARTLEWRPKKSLNGWKP